MSGLTTKINEKGTPSKCTSKGKFIGENMRVVDGSIHMTAASNIRGLLTFLDFQKAHVWHSWMENVNELDWMVLP